MKDRQLKKAEDKGFTQGVGWAIQYLVKWADQPTYAKDIYKESGIPISDFKKHCDESDFEYVKEAARN